MVSLGRVLCLVLNCWGSKMSKEELLRIMRLLSALEALGMTRTPEIPQYLLDDLDEAVRVLEREIVR
jgi:hypothetical protein